MPSSNKILAFLFPGQGQGSIKVGMGQDVFKHSPAARKIFSEADRFFERPISKLCFRGPEEELLKTINAQPASLVVNLAYAEVWRQLKQALPAYLAGHSVGYIAALVFAQVITLRQGLEIVRERARLMEEACHDYPGKMVALLNPDIRAIEMLCLEFGVDIGNRNSDIQIVLSGLIGSVDEITQEILQKGLVGKAVPLNTEGAFHSRWMRSVQEPLAEFLRPMHFDDPRIPIISNQAMMITKGTEAKEEVWRQPSRPVLWQQSMELLHRKGVASFIEMGAGEVLSNNLKRSPRLKGAGVKVVPFSAFLTRLRLQSSRV